MIDMGRQAGACWGGDVDAQAKRVPGYHWQSSRERLSLAERPGKSPGEASGGGRAVVCTIHGHGKNFVQVKKA